ncbi:MAG: potassium channel family protein [Muribaculaceae bacterium]|nr:potassium channel family protein [Muribaculaceae bacterium]
MSSTAATPAFKPAHRGDAILKAFNFVVLILSGLLIVWITLDTFNNVNFLESHHYMTFQFWVCIVFIADFFVGLFYADRKWRYFRRRLIFLLLSIPYLNIIHHTGMQLDHGEVYFLRFIPLARAALAMSIVIGYMSANAVTSLCISYLTIIVFVTYFCSLIFYQREAGLNPDVHTYWTALWWSAMNMTTVGSSIEPVTVAGKIVEVILPICGMIIFPLFTVYLTNYVTGIYGQNRQNSSDSDADKKTAAK